MRLSLARFRCVLLVAMLSFCGIAGRPSVASALGPYLEPGFGPCVVPTAMTDSLDCPWYDVADAGRYHAFSTYDRSPTLASEAADLCEIVRDRRHSAGLAEAEDINQQNDGISRSPVRAVDQDMIASAEPDLGVHPDRTHFEYSLPMSRCEQYWCDPWYDYTAWEDTDFAAEADHYAVEKPDPSRLTVVDGDPPADPLHGFDFSVCRAAARPVASMASDWLGSLGQRLLGLSQALGQIADAKAAEELSDAPAPEPGQPQDAPLLEEVPQLTLGI